MLFNYSAAFIINNKGINIFLLHCTRLETHENVWQLTDWLSTTQGKRRKKEEEFCGSGSLVS